MLVAESHEPLIDIIERFNRKERYVLFQQVATEGEVQLSPDFRKRLCALGWPVPEHGVLILMDYWIAPSSVEGGLCRLGGCRGGGDVSVVGGFELGGWDVAAVAM